MRKGHVRNSCVDFRLRFGCCVRGPLQGRGSEAEAALLTPPGAWGLGCCLGFILRKKSRLKDNEKALLRSSLQ